MKNIWLILLIIYVASALMTFIPTLVAILKKVELNPGGASFDECPHFSEENRLLLQQHFTRITGTLGFWKNQAEKYRRFHYYCLCWTIPSSIIIPILIQYVTDNNLSKILITVISAHVAILLAFHRGFKVDRNFRSFRQGESEFYDTYRRMLDRPSTFGETQREQIEKYIAGVELIRKFVRNAEVDNMPAVDDVRPEPNRNP